MSFVTQSKIRAGPILLFVAAASICNTSVYGQKAAPLEELPLSVAVAHALEQHPGALSAEAGVAAAKATAGEASAARLPQIQFEASATRYQEPMIVAPLHALDMTRAPEFDRTLLRGTASASYVLFDGGVRGSRIRGAQAELGAAESSKETALASVVAGVTRSYLQVISASDLLESHDNRLSALEAELDRANKLLAEGTAPRVSVLRAEAAIAQATADRVAAAAALDVAERNLARLTGLSPLETRADKLVPVTPGTAAVAGDRETLIAEATESNPELQRAREKHDAALAAKRAAKAAWIPNLSLFGGYLGFGSGGGDLVTEWQGGAKISYPIFTGGARINTNARYEALVELRAQELRQTELAVLEGVDRGISALHEATARLAAVEDAVAHLSEVARIEQLALTAGSGTQTEYLRAEAELLGVRASLIEARNGEIVAMVELARIIGRLDQEWIDHELEHTHE